jgi:hypothetical protein
MPFRITASLFIEDIAETETGPATGAASSPMNRPGLTRRAQTAQGAGISGSPTAVPQTARPGLAHQRKDSETLRSFPRAASSTSLDALHAAPRPNGVGAGNMIPSRTHRRNQTASDAESHYPAGMENYVVGASDYEDGEPGGPPPRPSRIQTQQLPPSMPPASAPPVQQANFANQQQPRHVMVQQVQQQPLRTMVVCSLAFTRYHPSEFPLGEPTAIYPSRYGGQGWHITRVPSYER